MAHWTSGDWTVFGVIAMFAFCIALTIALGVHDYYWHRKRERRLKGILPPTLCGEPLEHWNWEDQGLPCPRCAAQDPDRG